jgi:hypothetical protein
MIPPELVTIYEGELASFWFDENGILCANSKSVPRTLEKQKTNYELVRQITGNKPVCLLADNTATYTQDNTTREFSAQEMPKLFKAMAVISGTTIGRAASHLFTYFHGQPIPIRSFDNEKDAKEWLMQYLQEVV